MNRKLKKLEISDIAILVAISVLVLIVSYMLAAQLYDKSHLIPYGVLVVLFFLLLESGVVCCYSFLDKLSSVFTKKQQKNPSVMISKRTASQKPRSSNSRGRMSYMTTSSGLWLPFWKRRRWLRYGWSIKNGLNVLFTSLKVVTGNGRPIRM